MLRKLQCSVYSRLYPLLSRSAADARLAVKASRGLSLSSSLEAEALRSPAPEGRRLRPSQSLHSMFSVQEHNKLNLRHSLSSTPFIEDQGFGRPGREAEEAAPSLPERESSFEDLEQFLSASETWPGRPPHEDPARKKSPSQQEHLKAVVKDIHNAIGEGHGGRTGGGWQAEALGDTLSYDVAAKSRVLIPPCSSTPTFLVSPCASVRRVVVGSGAGSQILAEYPEINFLSV